MAHWIEAMEKQAAHDARTKGLVPTPEGKEWDRIRDEFDLKPTPVDEVLSQGCLPPKWRLVADPHDPYQRSSLILDERGQKVGSTFLKQTPYDYHGSTTFFKAEPR